MSITEIISTKPLTKYISKLKPTTICYTPKHIPNLHKIYYNLYHLHFHLKYQLPIYLKTEKITEIAVLELDLSCFIEKDYKIVYKIVFELFRLSKMLDVKVVNCNYRLCDRQYVNIYLGYRWNYVIRNKVYID